MGRVICLLACLIWAFTALRILHFHGHAAHEKMGKLSVAWVVHFLLLLLLLLITD